MKWACQARFESLPRRGAGARQPDVSRFHSRGVSTKIKITGQFFGEKLENHDPTTSDVLPYREET